MIFYVGTYGTPAIMDRQPMATMSQNAKMAYIISVIKKLGNNIKVVSVVSGHKFGLRRRLENKVDEKETDIFLESLDIPIKGISKVCAFQRICSLFLFLVFNVKKSDTVLVYNTQVFSVPVRLAKKLKKFRLILEIEEFLYLDHTKKINAKRSSQEKKLINVADGYILVNNLMSKHIDETKPYAVAYGGYDIPPRTKERLADGNIHIVYAGGIDALRRVDVAVKAMEFLPENYRLHILGQGPKKDISDLMKCINEVNGASNLQKVKYEGCLLGRQYDEFLQSCHIGINMQMIGAPIEEFAYPSKISSYLGRGLNVVSGSLKSIESSPFAKGISFFQENTPEAVAKAILSCDKRSYDDQVQLIKEAEKSFYSGLEKLMS